jgi:RHS repeat-associated protein
VSKKNARRYDELASGSLVGEYDGTGALIEETVWLGDIPVATIQPNGSTVAVYYVHTDHLNTPRQVTRPADNAQMWTWLSDPFGTDAANTNPAGAGALGYNLRFPGQIFHGPAGLHQNYFRDFDPATGRYVESDPIGLAGGTNTYQYSLANPLTRADPYGLWSTEAHNWILQQAFAGLPPDLLQYLEEGSAGVDAFSNQFGDSSYMHAMRAPGESVADARVRACRFIKDNLARYNLYKDAPYSSLQQLAYQSLGQALHPIMDSTSPSHSGWQVWNPLGNIAQIFEHGDMPGSREMLGDLTDPLLQETLRRIRAAMDGKSCDCSL